MGSKTLFFDDLCMHVLNIVTFFITPGSLFEMSFIPFFLKPYGFLIFLLVRERVHREQTGQYDQKKVSFLFVIIPKIAYFFLFFFFPIFPSNENSFF